MDYGNNMLVITKPVPRAMPLAVMDMRLTLASRAKPELGIAGGLLRRWERFQWMSVVEPQIQLRLVSKSLIYRFLSNSKANLERVNSPNAFALVIILRHPSGQNCSQYAIIV